MEWSYEWDSEMKKTYKETCLIELKIGDKVQEIRSGRIGTLRDIKLVPNTRHDVVDGRGLVAALYVKMEGGTLMEATSDKFLPVIDEPYEYEEFFPSVHLEKIE